LLLPFFLGCKDKTNLNVNYKKPSESKLKLVSNSTITFKLSESTVPSEGVQYYVDKSVAYLIFLNAGNNALDFYDMHSRGYKFSYGFKNILKSASGFYVHNMDSIFLYSDPKKEFILSNLKGTIKQFSIKQAAFRHNVLSASPIINASHPVFVINGNLIYSGYKFGEVKKVDQLPRYYSASLNLKSGIVTDFNRYPIIYDNYNWGGRHLRQPYVDYNPKKKIFVSSLPIMHNLIITDQANYSTTQIYGGSNNVENIPPMKDAITYLSNREDDVKATAHFYLNDSYRNIIYDRFRDIYYRVVEYASEKSKIDDDGAGEKRDAIIILDNDLKIKGETSLNKGISIWTYFVSEDGLCLLNTNFNNENYAVFSVYKISKN